MSAGHSHPDNGENTYFSSQVINKLENMPEIRQRLWDHVIDRSYDLPYVGGYSQDGKIIYIDRHFPDKLTYEIDGFKKTFDAIPFIIAHEAFEKAVIDVCDWGYWDSHHAANGHERRRVLAAGLLWLPYNKVLAPYEKAEEHEKLKRVPADLDMTPYYAKPVNHKLVAHMEKVMKKAA